MTGESTVGEEKNMGVSGGMMTKQVENGTNITRRKIMKLEYA
jgi:hypothetical protein